MDAGPPGRVRNVTRLRAGTLVVPTSTVTWSVSCPPWLSVTGLVDAAAERQRVRELVQLADTAGSRWSKGVRLQRLVRQLGEPLIVFSEFRDSLDACRELL